MSLEINFLTIITWNTTATLYQLALAVLWVARAEIISCVTSDWDGIGHYHRIYFPNTKNVYSDQLCLALFWNLQNVNIFEGDFISEKVMC